MTPARVRELLHEIPRLRAAVIGDFCLDAYWFLDPSLSESSLETGRPTLAVAEQRYGPGGAGNVVANLLSLGVEKVWALGIVGEDLFGRELLRLLEGMGADTSCLFRQAKGWQTSVYAKPHVNEEEQSRLDFGVKNRPDRESERRLVRALREKSGRADLVIANQQLRRGVWSPALLSAACRLASAPGRPAFVADSRNMPDRFEGAVLRINAREAAGLCGERMQPDQRLSVPQARRLARRIHRRRGAPVFVSLDEGGTVVAWSGRSKLVRGVGVEGPVDAVGAGDASLAATGAALAASADPAEAAELAALAAAVTVTKLRATGTATPAEILRLARR